MKNSILAFVLLFGLIPLRSSTYVPADYIWTTPSQNSSESMPCGGHDIGMNVWVENGDILFYIQQSGWFDENNTLLKAGRWRLTIKEQNNKRQAISDNSSFEQRLCLYDGAVYIRKGQSTIRLWADVNEPVVFCELKSTKKVNVTLSYENWRYQDRPITKAECQQTSYKWTLPSDATTFADSVSVSHNVLRFAHHNRMHTVFDYTIGREHLEAVKENIYNPIGGLCMDGEMQTTDFTFNGISDGTYAQTDFRSWNFKVFTKNAVVAIRLNASKQPTTNTTAFTPDKLRKKASHSRKQSSAWWQNFWQRSWIETDNEEASEMVRNYELMRYMLGCNAMGQWPTKFNGGLFTFDPCYAISLKDGETFTPDYRKWGGGTMTAQNQRLVYWPMLKSGDAEMMTSAFNTYLRLLPTAMLWSRHFWGHPGACFTEQLENCGLPNPAEYGKHKEGEDRGVEHNKWLEYEWDTCLEFCQMILLAHDYAALDIKQYEQLVSECLLFFYEHYQWESTQRTGHPLDSLGKLRIYPGSGCETYKMADNPSSTIAALHTVTRTFLDYLNHRADVDSSARESIKTFSSALEMLPDLPTSIINGDTLIAPAKSWERIQNVETPQLYPVFPWRLYGVGRQGLNIAVNTYMKDAHALEMRSSKGWKQDNIWAACLGVTSEAKRLNKEKLSSGPYRFPAFWDPAFDWAPDHNRGGAAMIGLQEMLLQESADGSIILFPAWPKEWNCRFRLHASKGRLVEAEIKNGIITSK